MSRTPARPAESMSRKTNGEEAYIGDGDFVCDLHGLGPEETVFVLEDWEPMENYLQCRRGGAAR